MPIENVSLFPVRDYHLRALSVAMLCRLSGNQPYTATVVAYFTCRHYQEIDHGQRTTAQDQGSQETQEAACTCRDRRGNLNTRCKNAPTN